MKIIVASKNPLKTEAVRQGFKRVFPNEELSFEGIDVDPGVSHQPMSEEETFQGAKQRAQKAKEAFPDADFWCGLEGGVHDHPRGMDCLGYVVILSKKNMGYADTGHFQLPEKVAALVRQGMELGPADDQVFGQTNSKQVNGAVGLLTHDVITRVDGFSYGVVLALIPFVNKELY